MEPGIATAFDTSFATAKYLMPWLARRDERHAPSADLLIAGVSDYADACRDVRARVADNWHSDDHHPTVQFCL
jgi:hypothetical protein